MEEVGREGANNDGVTKQVTTEDHQNLNLLNSASQGRIYISESFRPSAKKLGIYVPTSASH